MRKLFSILIIFFTCFTLHSQQFSGKVPGYQSSASTSLVQDKNFYLFTAIQEAPEVKRLLKEDKRLQKILEYKRKNIQSMLEGWNAKGAAEIFIKPYLFSETEIEEVAVILKKHVRNNTVLNILVDTNIRPANAYIHFETGSNEDLIEAAWRLNSQGINQALKIYGTGEKGLYPNIDSAAYAVNSNYYKSALKMWGDQLEQEDSSGLFFEPSLNMALALLYLNHKDEAARFEPLEEKENSAAVAYIEDIEFEDYEYASILILGNGPINYKDRLSPLGKLNLRLGYNHYKAGKAPLIIVSGGSVHPFRTKSNEAIEMKRELMEIYSVPEAHIIIEPHARHTTTNLRNAARLLYKYKVPYEKKNLVVTNEEHSKYVTSPNITKRFLEELSYLPVHLQNRVDRNTVEYIPRIEAMQQNPLDPLDP